jgi:hypothetical protein
VKRAHVVVSVLAFTGAVACSVFTSSNAHAQLAPPSLFGQPAAPFGTNPGAPNPGTPNGPNGSGRSSGTVAQLNQGESEDSGRRLELVYVNADVGGGFLAGTGLSQGYFGFGASAGVRLLTFTLGARVRDHLGSVNLLAIGGEAAYHLVLGSADLVLGAHGGYAGVTNTLGSSGGNVGLDVGLDYYLSSTFSVGGSVSPDLYFVGGSTAFGLFVGPRAGVHFGL